MEAMEANEPPMRLTVSSVDDWIEVNAAVDGFEDGVVKELWLDGATWLTDDDNLVERGYPKAIVVVQLQSSAARSAKMEFAGVRAMTVDLGRDVTPAQATADRDAWTVTFLSCTITAEGCEVSVLGDKFVGPGPFLLGD
jgi:hypothetical protein